eukprot:12888297-Prorocentrum_lima.AAC.1
MDRSIQAVERSMHVVIEAVDQLEKHLTHDVERRDSEVGGEVQHEDEGVEVVPSVPYRREEEL